tara:strand:+ start:907 stop:2700 length:1794 start_codon:yes stop_codon:yes gene_type:complete
MCGIFAYLSEKILTTQPLHIRQMIVTEFMKLQHRGPDNSSIMTVHERYLFGFHRLSIMDTSVSGNQPFVIEYGNKKVLLLCNGEIYNYKELKTKYNLQTKSNSDCEVILQLYLTFLEEEMTKMDSDIKNSCMLVIYERKIIDTIISKIVKELDGVFSFIIYDERYNIMSVARDPFGIRSLYWGYTGDCVCFSSEIKAIHNLCNDINFFPPGSYSCFSASSNEAIIVNNCKQYYSYDYEMKPFKMIKSGSKVYSENIGKLNYITHCKKNIRKKLEKAVSKRLMADREIGCLLSGGLDSSLIAGILAKELKKQNRVLHTFSIGMSGSTDLFHAKQVADHIKSNHHEIVVTKEDMLNKLKEVIYKIESWDTTTIRASTPMILLCEWIKQNTKVTVIFSGEGSDEASGSYLYFNNAPNDMEFHKETCRLLKDLQYFDVLRSDKSVSSAGLEVRVPFLDKEFIEYYMQIDAQFKRPNGYFTVEKHLLRDAFDNNLLPKNVLWRTKEAFSDGCSSKNDSWYSIIQKYIKNVIIPKLYKNNSKILQQDYEEFTHEPPKFDEALYYRIIFNEYYPKVDTIIPYYWIPKWCGDIQEPSARVLDVYN